MNVVFMELSHPGIFFLAGFFKNRHNLVMLWINHNMAVFFDDARLLFGNFRQCLSQILHMVVAYGCYDGYDGICIVNDIGGIDNAPHANFQHDNIAAVSRIVQQTHGGKCFKICRVGVVFGGHNADGFCAF